MIYWLLFLIVFFAIGCIAKYRQLVKKVNDPQQYTLPSNKIEQVRQNVIWGFYMFSVFAILFGHQAITNSYFDFLTLEFLFLLLMCIWLTALCGEFVLPGGVVKFYDERGGLLFHYLLVFLLFMGGLLILSTAPADLASDVKGLINGPQFTTGIIQGQSSSGGRVASFYVQLGGESYSMPNSKWWRSVKKGDEIQYGYNPYATGFSPDIFPPEEIGFTIPGIILILLAGFLLLSTLYIAVDGYRNWLFPPTISVQALATYYPHSHTLAEHETIQLSGCSKLFLGLTIVIGLFLVWRRHK
jgi:hypothetical protein